MYLFHNLFAAYYRILMSFRKNKFFRHTNRGGTEDFGALCFLAASQIYFLLLIFFGVKFVFKLNTSELSYGTRQLLKGGIFFVGVILFYIEYRYFLSKRARRSRILDNFDNLDEQKRKQWINIAVTIMLFPLWALIGMIIYRSFR